MPRALAPPQKHASSEGWQGGRTPSFSARLTRSRARWQRTVRGGRFRVAALRPRCWTPLREARHSSTATAGNGYQTMSTGSPPARTPPTALSCPASALRVVVHASSAGWRLLLVGPPRRETVDLSTVVTPQLGAAGVFPPHRCDTTPSYFEYLLSICQPRLEDGFTASPAVSSAAEPRTRLTTHTCWAPIFGFR